MYSRRRPRGYAWTCSSRLQNQSYFGQVEIESYGLTTGDVLHDNPDFNDEEKQEIQKCIDAIFDSKSLKLSSCLVSPHEWHLSRQRLNYKDAPRRLNVSLRRGSEPRTEVWEETENAQEFLERINRSTMTGTTMTANGSTCIRRSSVQSQGPNTTNVPVVEGSTVSIEDAGSHSRSQSECANRVARSDGPVEPFGLDCRTALVGTDSSRGINLQPASTECRSTHSSFSHPFSSVHARKAVQDDETPFIYRRKSKMPSIEKDCPGQVSMYEHIHQASSSPCKILENASAPVLDLSFGDSLALMPHFYVNKEQVNSYDDIGICTNPVSVPRKDLNDLRGHTTVGRSRRNGEDGDETSITAKQFQNSLLPSEDARLQAATDTWPGTQMMLSEAEMGLVNVTQGPESQRSEMATEHISDITDQRHETFAPVMQTPNANAQSPSVALTATSDSQTWSPWTSIKRTQRGRDDDIYKSMLPASKNTSPSYQMQRSSRDARKHRAVNSTQTPSATPSSTKLNFAVKKSISLSQISAGKASSSSTDDAGTFDMEEAIDQVTEYLFQDPYS